MKTSILVGLLGLSVASGACKADADSTSKSSASTNSAGLVPISITVDGSGYHPDSVRAAANQPARLVFTRTSDEGCGQQLVFPSLDIRKDLPLNQPVAVDVTTPASGSLAFTCGMDMYRGAVVAE